MSSPPRAQHPRPWWRRLACGGAAGLVGTAVLQALGSVSRKRWPATMPPLREAPDQFLVEKAEQLLPAETRMPPPAKAAAIRSLRVGYGLAFGIAYAALRPHGGPRLRDGAALGVGAWLISYAGWLPAAGLTPPLTQQTPAEITGPLARHALFGIATVAACQWLAGRSSPGGNAR